MPTQDFKGTVNGLTLPTVTAAGQVPYGTGANALGVLAATAMANKKMFGNADGNAPEWATGFIIKDYARILSAASGNVAYTGVGFAPAAFILIATVAGAANIFHIAMACGAVTVTVGLLPRTAPIWNRTSSHLLYVEADAADGSCSQTADLVSLDSDGFTLSWTKVGTPTATLDFYVLPLR